MKAEEGLSVSDVVPEGQDLTAQRDADAGADADKPTAGTRGVVETAQNLLGFLIAGFAAVLSFMGIKSSEIASILRNEEPLIGFIALPFLFSIITAILSVFKGSVTHGKYDWPTNRFAVGSLLFLFAIITLLPAIIQIPFITSPWQWRTSIIIGGLAIFLSVVIVFRMDSFLKKLLGKYEELPEASETKDEELPKPSEIWKSWSKRHFNLQLYLVLASVLFLTIAAYSALRLESASQVEPFAQLDGSVTIVKNGSAVLSLSVVSAKVPAPDRVDITVTALPRTVSIHEICKGARGAKVPLNSFSCAADPCNYKPFECKSLVGWAIPPDANGAVREILTLPFSPFAWQRLHIEDQLCERANQTLLCVHSPAGGTYLDIQVPAPSP